MNNMRNQLVSIIVPAFNAEKKIKRCLESIIGNDYENIEIIVIDDGSVDNTQNIVKEIACNDSRVHLYTQENSGVSAARNAGMSYSNGEIIGFVDSDDYVTKDYVSKMVNKMDGNIDFVICNVQKKENGIIEPFNVLDNEAYNQKDILELFVSGKLEGNVWRCLFRKRIIAEKSIKYSSLKLFEDLLFLIEYLVNCKEVAIEKDFLYIYDRTDEGTVANMGNEKYLIDIMGFPNYLVDVLKKHRLDDIFGGYIAREQVVSAMRIRIMENASYGFFKNKCKSNLFRKNLKKDYLKKIELKRQKVYYWSLLYKQFWICNMIYYLGRVKHNIR